MTVLHPVHFHTDLFFFSSKPAPKKSVDLVFFLLPNHRSPSPCSKRRHNGRDSHRTMTRRSPSSAVVQLQSLFRRSPSPKQQISSVIAFSSILTGFPLRHLCGG
ncbi:hypothetical protein QJS10_CPB11g01970 [Acorus calamus]|uniref:Uncharacterized protein n=1 Tax=Acorus calamus TaxID=4465 RepID=A0AAV9DSN9_ACOCL|nr:hypothetical protein QJS10_CPB11g01970 [Acorus calamus]